MIDLAPDLLALGKTVKQKFVMHLKVRGHYYTYQLVDEKGRNIGKKSVWRGKERGVEKESIVYTLGDKDFTDLEAFLIAYRQQLRDEEFEAAAPKKIREA